MTWAGPGPSACIGSAGRVPREHPALEVHRLVALLAQPGRHLGRAAADLARDDDGGLGGEGAGVVGQSAAAPRSWGCAPRRRCARRPTPRSRGRRAGRRRTGSRRRWTVGMSAGCTDVDGSRPPRATRRTRGGSSRRTVCARGPPPAGSARARSRRRGPVLPQGPPHRDGRGSSQLRQVSTLPPNTGVRCHDRCNERRTTRATTMRSG